MSDAFRLWFILVYAVAFAVFLAELFRFRARRQAVERQSGPFPPIPGLLNWVIALIVLLTRVGEISAGWPLVRVVGVGLSLWALVVLPWAIHALGRSYVPGIGVLREHALVSSGPFRLVRHPIYSAVAALWLGAALGTLNWLLLLLWPVLVAGVLNHARAEEEMMRAKFGAAYDAYAAGRGGIVPRLPGRRRRDEAARLGGSSTSNSARGGER